MSAPEARTALTPRSSRRRKRASSSPRTASFVPTCQTTRSNFLLREPRLQSRDGRVGGFSADAGVDHLNLRLVKPLPADPPRAAPDSHARGSLRRSPPSRRIRWRGPAGRTCRARDAPVRRAAPAGAAADGRQGRGAPRRAPRSWRRQRRPSAPERNSRSPAPPSCRTSRRTRREGAERCDLFLWGRTWRGVRQVKKERLFDRGSGG